MLIGPIIPSGQNGYRYSVAQSGLCDVREMLVMGEVNDLRAARQFAQRSETCRRASVIEIYKQIISHEGERRASFIQVQFQP